VDAIVERCAGLDVHRDDVVATVRVPGQGRRRWDQHTRTFRATLAGLSEVAAWLAEFGVMTRAPEIGPAGVRASSTLENGSEERIDEGTTSHAGAGGSQA
jgi:hypothetical protein